MFALVQFPSLFFKQCFQDISELCWPPQGSMSSVCLQPSKGSSKAGSWRPAPWKWIALDPLPIAWGMMMSTEA